MIRTETSLLWTAVDKFLVAGSVLAIVGGMAFFCFAACKFFWPVETKTVRVEVLPVSFVQLTHLRGARQ
ncbi:MAG: hypothetical protein P4M05_28055 [Bradyrhizobium sp.]|nr:hypothetical protein [Bradyrhizobium sp.]